MIDKTPIIITCDENYFNHCAVFIQSYLQHNADIPAELHLHSINISKDRLETLRELPVKVFESNINLSTKRTIMCRGVDGGHPRMRGSLRSRLYSEQQCFCAHNKIFLANKYLNENYDQFLVLDVDCIFQGCIKSIFNLPGDFILRYKQRNDYISFKEGCMLIKNTPSTKKLFQQASNILMYKFKNKQEYDIDSDHIVLRESFETLKGTIDLKQLPIEFKDTLFNDKSLIWSGKGDRKTESNRYKSKYKYYYDLFCDK